MISKESTKVLIIRNAALGDVLLATSVIPVIKKRFPDSEIDFETSCPEILAYNTNVNKILNYGSATHSEYKNIFDLDNSYEKDPYNSIFLAFSNVIQCDVNELQLDFNVSVKELDSAEDILKKHLILSHNFITIQSGASFWLKKMSPEYLEVLIENFKKRYSLTFLLLGSKKDPFLKGTVDLRGKCTFLESAALIKISKAFIGIDSALIHVAKAFKIPVAGFFGHTDPSKRIQIGKDDCIFISKTKCKYCYHRRKPPVIISFCKMQPIYWQVMDQIIQLALQLLKKRNNRYIRFIINKLYIFQENKRSLMVARCMKDIEKQNVLTELDSWLKDIVYKQV